jgi:predicted nucleic acid binding AN1-type Zn finger protein
MVRREQVSYTCSFCKKKVVKESHFCKQQEEWLQQFDLPTLSIVVKKQVV